MKIKRYTAPSMRAALALVRSEQGPDAVILSSRRSDEGIEVIAAVDYDEALFKQVMPPRSVQPVAPAPAPASGPAARATAAPRRATPPASISRTQTVAAKAAAPRAPVAGPVQARATPRPIAATAAAAPAPAADPSYGAMQRELQDLRRL